MALEIRNISGGYGGNDICKEISCEIEDGKILCILGPNGSGKSTLFKLILGLIKKSQGDILYNGKSLFALNERELAKIIAYIPQQHEPMFAFTALDIVLMGRTSHFNNFSMPQEADIDAAKRALEKLGILDLQTKNYMLLSGGQRQLVLIARAICQESKILIMDEPASNLDFANAQNVMEIIKMLTKDGYIIILSTHSPEQPFDYGDRVLLMKDGTVYACGDPLDVLTTKNILEVYGIHMDIIHVKDSRGRMRSICLPVSKPDITNIFITGIRKIGKTTLVRNVMEKLEMSYNGYLTLPDTTYVEGNTYVMQDMRTGEREPISEYDNGVFQVVQSTFDNLGVRCIHDSMQAEEPWIILDEIGRFESRSMGFLQMLERAFDSPKIVVGVLKKEEIPYIQEYKKRSDSVVLDLDEMDMSEAEMQLTFHLKGLKK